MTWLLKGKELVEAPENYEGFVYLITELDTNLKYIGKKLFKKRIKKTVKKKKKSVLVESDWKDYYGSSNNLLAAIEIKGKKNYRREILRLCKTKGELSYFEMREQVIRNVLLRDDYYNQYVGCRVNSSSLKNLKENYNAENTLCL